MEGKGRHSFEVTRVRFCVSISGMLFVKGLAKGLSWPRPATSCRKTIVRTASRSTSSPDSTPGPDRIKALPGWVESHVAGMSATIADCGGTVGTLCCNRGRATTGSTGGSPGAAARGGGIWTASLVTTAMAGSLSCALGCGPRSACRDLSCAGRAGPTDFAAGTVERPSRGRDPDLRPRSRGRAGCPSPSILKNCANNGSLRFG